MISFTLRPLISEKTAGGRLRLKRDGTRAETRFRLSRTRTSPFKWTGASVQSTAGSRGVRISVSNAGCTTFRGSVRVFATHSIRQFPLHLPTRTSPCAIRFQRHSTPSIGSKHRVENYYYYHIRGRSQAVKRDLDQSRMYTAGFF